MLHDKRIKYFAPADYTENSKLDILVRSIIERTAANEVLENIYYDCKEERDNNDTRKQNNEEKRKRLDLIISLNGSGNFNTTHTIIKKLSRFDEWEPDEIDMLLEIALNNHQVGFILNDNDLKAFYRSIIGRLPESTENSIKIEKKFNEK